MLNNGLSFLLNTFLGLFTVIFLLRFYLQLCAAPFKNPVGQTLISISQFIVKPLRRVIPSIGKFDVSTLLLAFICQLLLVFTEQLLRGLPISLISHEQWWTMLALALIGIIKLSFYIFLYATIAQSILSWINPYTMITPLLSALTKPLLAPLQKLVPIKNGLDFSPFIFFIIGELCLIMFISPLEETLMRLF